MSFPLPAAVSLWAPSSMEGLTGNESVLSPAPAKWAPPVEVKPPSLKGVFVTSYLGLDAR